MLSIFQKKIYLRDLLSGLVDIHNHLLPGIDDGAAEIADSSNLVSMFQDLGIQRFIATPHVMNDYYPNTPETIGKALSLLRGHLKSEGSNTQVNAAAEYMMDQSFLELLEKERLLCLYQDYVLVEMSYLQAPINLNEILFKLQTQKYRPILAHPERYVYFHSKDLEKFKELKRRGCLLQLNILSLTGHYGSNIQDVALHLLKEKMIDFIGTDTHQPRHLEKLSQAQFPQKKIDLIKPPIQNTIDTFSPAFT